ncbi:MAG: methyl-accepting chemotaxis protein [Lachnospiraceae bacterium]|jgi:methyl-accepting chemotaxis protein|nr:methyl-accepting chemotaxis protein [Lachnospiraceae bacterium]
MVVTIFLAVSLVCLAVVLIMYGTQRKKYQQLEKQWGEKEHWYIGMLDAIPFPISVTDNNMDWTFINHPVEQMLQTTREKCVGTQCSNWGAKICKSGNCGITCLKNGKQQTFFEQGGSDFQVDVNYLYDAQHNKIGHIEVVQDISRMTKIAKKQEGMIHDANAMSEQLVDLAADSANNAQKIASGASEQSASVEELSATVEGIAHQTQVNAANMKQATGQTTLAADEIRNSNTKMTELIGAMSEIDEISQKINLIIATIEDIASQTNLLSLNASIEAARAGDSGRGFAVVADQIGKLAGQSAEAAKDTKQLIETTLAAIGKGNQLTNETANSLNQVMETINEIRDAAMGMTQIFNDQADVIEQVNQGLGLIANIIQENSVIAGHSSETSQLLSEQSRELKRMFNE